MPTMATQLKRDPDLERAREDNRLLPNDSYSPPDERVKRRLEDRDEGDIPVKARVSFATPYLSYALVFIMLLVMISEFVVNYTRENQWIDTV